MNKNLAQILKGDRYHGCEGIPVTETQEKVVSELKGIGSILMTFIRAPYIEQAGENVEVLAEVDGRIGAARQKNKLVTAFQIDVK